MTQREGWVGDHGMVVAAPSLLSVAVGAAHLWRLIRLTATTGSVADRTPWRLIGDRGSGTVARLTLFPWN